jgi:hypothetical protein
MGMACHYLSHDVGSSIHLPAPAQPWCSALRGPTSPRQTTPVNQFGCSQFTSTNSQTIPICGPMRTATSQLPKNDTLPALNFQHNQPVWSRHTDNFPSRSWIRGWICSSKWPREQCTAVLKISDLRRPRYDPQQPPSSRQGTPRTLISGGHSCVPFNLHLQAIRCTYTMLSLITPARRALQMAAASSSASRQLPRTASSLLVMPDAAQSGPASKRGGASGKAGDTMTDDNLFLFYS